MTPRNGVIYVRSASWNSVLERRAPASRSRGTTWGGKAGARYQSGLAGLRKSLGAEHARTGAAMKKLSLLYTYQGKYDEAGGLCREALAILRRNLGAGAPAVSSTAQRCSELADRMDR